MSLAKVTPLETLAAWLAEAEAARVLEPAAMALATASPSGVPSVRFVLCRGIDSRGVRFFTNYDSAKAHDLDATGRGAVAFHWATFQRQARIEGRTVRATAEESDTYFHSRPRGNQLAGAVSPQSHPIASLDELRARYHELEARLAGAPVPRPPGWGGYWLLADAVELWRGGPDRLHDRVRYVRDVPDVRHVSELPHEMRGVHDVRDVRAPSSAQGVWSNAHRVGGEGGREAEPSPEIATWSEVRLAP
jgi:pyridoxamine 5'-phosphate oxidase